MGRDAQDDLGSAGTELENREQRTENQRNKGNKGTNGKKSGFRGCARLIANRDEERERSDNESAAGSSIRLRVLVGQIRGERREQVTRSTQHRTCSFVPLFFTLCSRYSPRQEDTRAQQALLVLGSQFLVLKCSLLTPRLRTELHTSATRLVGSWFSVLLTAPETDPAALLAWAGQARRRHRRR